MSDVSTKVDLREDGILWMINTTIFHPRGLALAVDGNGQLYIQGDGEEVWIFEDDLAQTCMINFQEMLARHEARL